MPKPQDLDFNDYVVRLAEGQTRKGIVNEPRLYWDHISMDLAENGVVPGSPIQGTPGILLNGEAFPVRITRMIASICFITNGGENSALASQDQLQRFLLRLIMKNHFYMNDVLLPLSLWSNNAGELNPTTQPNVSTWNFIENGQPFILSTRDTLEVDLALNDGENPAGSGVPVNVTFTGVGMQSKRPYTFSSREVLTDLAPVIMSTVDFRNEGAEPVVITDMTVQVGAAVAAGGAGPGTPPNISARVSVGVRQVGNGTNKPWFVGPEITPPTVVNGLADAPLLGVTAGVGVVHEFPGDGLIWEPGEGLNVEIGDIQETQSEEQSVPVLALGFAGYIMVT